MIKKAEEILVNIDGASSGNPGDASVGIVIKDKKGTFSETLSLYIGQATNNVAEYTALVVALKKSLNLKAEKISIRSDSELLVKQINGVYKVKNDSLKNLNAQAMDLIGKFKSFKISHVRREDNKEADKLAKQAIKDYRRANRVIAA